MKSTRSHPASSHAPPKRASGQKPSTPTDDRHRDPNEETELPHGSRQGAEAPDEGEAPIADELRQHPGS